MKRKMRVLHYLTHWPTRYESGQSEEGLLLGIIGRLGLSHRQDQHCKRSVPAKGKATSLND